MGTEQDINKYGVSVTFEKILAHNIPGIFLSILLLMILDLISNEKIFEYILKNIDLKLITILFLSLIFLGFIFGLIIDEIKHVILEEMVYIPIAKKKGKKITFCDLDGNNCSESYYLPIMGLDYYKYNLKHFYSYCEFDANISFTLFIASFVVPKFLNYYFTIENIYLLAVGIILFGLGAVMAYAGYTAFCDYYSAFDNTLKGVLKKNEISGLKPQVG